MKAPLTFSAGDPSCATTFVITARSSFSLNLRRRNSFSSATTETRTASIIYNSLSAQIVTRVMYTPTKQRMERK